jgi:hypothetical protein
MRRAALSVGTSWDGRPIPETQHTRLRLEIEGSRVRLDLDAPFHGDSPPPGAPGRCPALWNHEVVELFLLGDDERYLEIELGPWGHYLVLELHKPRTVVRDDIPLDLAVSRELARWLGRCTFPADLLPPGLASCNAYTIHGAGDARVYGAAFPVPGARPDFHRLECFRPLPWDEG